MVSRYVSWVEGLEWFVWVVNFGGLYIFCRLRSIAAHRDNIFRRLSVCPSVCLSGSHTFLVVTHSYVSQATHAFLEISFLVSYIVWLIYNSAFIAITFWFENFNIYLLLFCEIHMPPFTLLHISFQKTLRSPFCLRSKEAEVLRHRSMLWISGTRRALSMTLQTTSTLGV